MNTLSYKTISANKETAKKEWVVIDATDQVVGRLCSKVAKLIRGKYKPNFTPHVDCGDNVIIINAAKAVFTGKITINKVELAKYFPSAILQYVVKQPLLLLGAEEKYDIKCNLDGGGFTGQSQALRLAIARALVKVDAEDKKALKAQGFLTRDSREVERKKPGQPKARRRFQFSKR